MRSHSARIHPLSIEAIVLAVSLLGCALIFVKYPSSINRGYRSGYLLHPVQRHDGACIHPLSIEAIVLAPDGKTARKVQEKYPSSINRGYRSGVARARLPSFAASIHPLSIEAIVLARLPTADYRWPPSPCIHPLSIEAIVLALVQ